MIVQFVTLYCLRAAVSVFESVRYWCDAIIIPLCYYCTLYNPSTAPPKPKHVAVILNRDAYAQKAAACLRDMRITDFTLIVDDPKAIHEKRLLSHVYVKGSYPNSMLAEVKKSSSPVRAYDLVISLQDRLDLKGVDARCIGFSTFAVVPCVCSFFVKMQMMRAMAVFGESRQNYGK